ncbi:MAG: ATPase [Prevotellaceae bacterium]|jgi:N-acetylglucosamine kinase-like BadF-type ATPase|nr:ATPase [Prevotellaceae bacterium]
MILLADGGSTKVDWCLVDRGVLKKRIVTKGANPFFRTTEDISADISRSLVPELKNYKIDAVYFYGAGCAFPEKNEIVRTAIARNFDAPKIEIGSDLFGAAVGLCGNKKGIVCILGTGSNSCFYDGEKIVKNISPLGFILGDEGSGAVLGKLFIGSCLKNQFSNRIKEEFLKFIDLSVPQILDKVYKQPMPNRFLASIAPFIKDNIQDNSIHELVYNAFADFFRKNVMQYDSPNHSVSFTGSVAYHFKDVLCEVASGLNIKILAIEQSPMKGLIHYYSK